MEYLVTFNRSISQAMQCTIQDLKAFLSAWPTSPWLIETATWSICVMGWSMIHSMPCILHRSICCWLKLPQLQNQNTNWTGSPLYLSGSRSGTGNRERNDVARPQLSNRNRLRALSRVNDIYCVQTEKLRISVWQIRKLEPFTNGSRKVGLQQ